MAIRDIILYPDDRLRKICEEVKEIDEEVMGILNDLVETMHNAEGVGLAAPQIGVNRRIFVIHCVHGSQKNLFGFVNPKIVEVGIQSQHNKVKDPIQEQSTISMGEGCLSIPGINAEVIRPTDIVIEAQVMFSSLPVNTHHPHDEGELVCSPLRNLEARVFQHELDHLNGILFTDYLDGPTRDVLLRQYEKADFVVDYGWVRRVRRIRPGIPAP